MSDKSVTQRLLIKDSYTVPIINAPNDYISQLGKLPTNVTILTATNEPVDLGQVFVTSQKELDALLERVKAFLKPKGLLWVSYLKRTSKVKADINRDIIWQYAQTVGFQAVSMVAIDETWSAMRLKLM